MRVASRGAAGVFLAATALFLSLYAAPDPLGPSVSLAAAAGKKASSRPLSRRAAFERARDLIKESNRLFRARRIAEALPLVKRLRGHSEKGGDPQSIPSYEPQFLGGHIQVSGPLQAGRTHLSGIPGPLRESVGPQRSSNSDLRPQ